MRLSPPANLTNLPGIRFAWIRHKAKYGGTGFKAPALLHNPLEELARRATGRAEDNNLQTKRERQARAEDCDTEGLPEASRGTAYTNVNPLWLSDDADWGLGLDE